MNEIEIKKRMLDMSVTVKDIANVLGVSQAQVYNKLKGKSMTTLEEAEKLQELLHIADCDFARYFLTHSRVS